MRKIILASRSPRRKEILKITGLNFTVCDGGYKEDLSLPLSPRALARYLSLKKAEAVAHKYRNAIIIAADTFIVFKNRLLGKPHTDREARKMLMMLNGKAHSVITGFTIMDTASNKILSRSVSTKVYFRKLDREEISAYIRSKEPLDKAGAYAIQGIGAILIEKIEGDFFNVMGLPLCALTEGLKKFGIHVLKQSQ
ncbi:MAG TPA: septum formation inhibitor Maf [Nitrospirae bacterium]|nr:septum formation protein Maf [bacterium BMS3Abin10]HDO25592.1 septum formation inhibitor Maf [Nitrospirota bacterium]HDZ83645.1 septum formation inhibitor Maf [Nitrospirota bacterium]